MREIGAQGRDPRASSLTAYKICAKAGKEPTLASIMGLDDRRPRHHQAQAPTSEAWHQVLGPLVSALDFGSPLIGYIENVSRAGSRSSSTSIRMARWGLT
jgi:hypothetical protein